MIVRNNHEKPVTDIDVLEMWLDVCLNEPYKPPKGHFDGYSKYVEAAAEYDDRGGKHAFKSTKHMIEELKKEGGMEKIIEMFPQIQKKIYEGIKFDLFNNTSKLWCKTCTHCTIIPFGGWRCNEDKNNLNRKMSKSEVEIHHNMGCASHNGFRRASNNEAIKICRDLYEQYYGISMQNDIKSPAGFYYDKHDLEDVRIHYWARACGAADCADKIEELQSTTKYESDKNDT